LPLPASNSKRAKAVMERLLPVLLAEGGTLSRAARSLSAAKDGDCDMTTRGALDSEVVRE